MHYAVPFPTQTKTTSLITSVPNQSHRSFEAVIGADLGVVVEAVEQLPEQDDGAEQQVGHRQPQDAAAQLLRQHAPLPHPLVVRLQVPVVLERGARTPCPSQRTEVRQRRARAVGSR